jgi:hypothetical protein
LTGMDFGFAPLTTATLTATPTRTPTLTATSTGLPTTTSTATPTLTPAATATVTLTGTATSIATATTTLTPMATRTSTRTPTGTSTLVPTVTPTLSPTAVGTPGGSLENPIPIACEQAYSGSTVGQASVISDYGSCGGGMWGPETVYSFHAGYTLDWLGISVDTPADLAVFVLTSANPATCFSSGGSVVVPSIAQGVTLYIVVDGSESGSYTLDVHCHPLPVTTPTVTPTRTATATTGPSPTPTKTVTPGGPSKIYLPIMSKPGIEFLVDCGAAVDYLDSTSRLWLADRAYTDGSWGYVGYSDTWSTNQDIVVDTPGLMRLYQTVRFGDAFGYQFDVPNGQYEVELYFAEVFHNAAAGGKLQSVVESFAITVTDGQLDLILDTKVDLAMINAIRVTRQ